MINIYIFTFLFRAITLGYNLPGVSGLQLSQAHIVGIYNGTYVWWNDSSLQHANPHITLPSQPIMVIARFDQSVTTQLFTAALSSYDSAWHNIYGSFSEGVITDLNEVKWKEGVISYFGHTDAGVAGLIMSLKYSIGYLRFSSSSILPGINLVHLENIHGDYVLPSLNTIRSAVINTEVISDQSSGYEHTVSYKPYPIIVYNFLVLQKEWRDSCSLYEELYRYIEWVLHDHQSRDICSEMGMVLADITTSALMMSSLNQFSCAGQNVAEKVKKHQVLQNTYTVQYVPSYQGITAAVCIVGLFLTGVLCVISFHQWRLYRVLKTNQWRIAIGELDFLTQRQEAWSPICNQSDRSANYLEQSTVTYERSRVVKLGTEFVSMKKLDIIQTRRISDVAKVSMLWMKNTIHHVNVVKFLGVTKIGLGHWHILREHYQRNLVDAIYDRLVQWDSTLKYSLVTDLAKAMNYLHKQNVIHGRMSSQCCYLDSRWTLKVSNWELYTLGEKFKESWTFKKKVGIYAVDSDFTIPSRALWLAPEKLATPKLSPSRLSDVYSYGLIFLEIFQRKSPFDHLLSQMDLNSVLAMAQLGDFRPQWPEELNRDFARVITATVSINIQDRPYFDKILRALRLYGGVNKSLIETMMTKIESKNNELKQIRGQWQNYIHDILPPHIAQVVSKGKPVHPEMFDCASILMLEVAHLTKLWKEADILDIISTLNCLYGLIDSTLEKYDACKTAFNNGTLTIASGIPINTTTHHATELATLSLDLACTVHTLFSSGKVRVKLKMAIHTGGVISVIVGLKAAKLCLFGDTMTIVSRMLNKLTESQIQLSETTHVQVSQMPVNFIMVPCGQINTMVRFTILHWV